MNQLDRQCEKFLGGPTQAYQERVHVTISSKGQIFLNQKAHKMMGAPLAVYLYFNRVKDMIILEPTDAIRMNTAFMVRHFGKDSTGRCVRANPFCKHFGIQIDGTLRFIAPDVDAAGRLYLKLSETVSVSQPKRRGPRKKRD